MEKKYNERGIKAIIWIGSILMILSIAYCTVCYSNIEFISKWRTIYIETAMSTMNHQWLADIFPKSVVNKVVYEMNESLQEADIAESKIPVSSKKEEKKIIASAISTEKSDKEKLVDQFDCIDEKSIEDGLDYTTLDGHDISDKNIKTTNGDTVYLIDRQNGIIIINIAGENYIGKLAIVNDCKQVKLQKSKLKFRGQTVTEMCKDSGSILGINACGFADYAGCGNGSTPVGLVKIDGKLYNDVEHSNLFQIVGFDTNNNLRIGYDVDINTIRDGVQFYPTLVLNGQKIVDGSDGLGIQPRTAIGQTIDKKFLMLEIDGRQIGYSLGATVGDCADILAKYNAYNGINMDGGSSSSMTYNGTMITKTSSPQRAGRYIPTCWVVSPADNINNNNKGEITNG